MEVKIIKEEKNELEFSVDSLTIAEVLREYLNKEEGVSFVAWRQEHPNKPAIFRVETKGKTAKKAVEDAISQIEKETDKLLDVVKKQ